MKLAASAARLKRYNESNDRKTQNQIFNSNEKKFYRSLAGNEMSDIKPPSEEEITNFWSNLWSNPVEHDDNAPWIQEEIDRQANIEEQADILITTTELTATIRSTHNWRCPGADHVQNYWYKKLTAVHPFLAEQINRIIRDPECAPEFITEGRTFIKPKDEDDTENPANYRPITCLPTIYKIITATICNKISKHLTSNNIMAEEQKGCRKRSKGCKEQLIIDSVIRKQTEKHQRNLHTAFIDYRKAFDTVPHSWLLRILEIYKINPVIRQFLASIMKKWKTKIQLRTADKQLETEFINILRGIFQGDALSALWFCMCLNPLSNALNKTKSGFHIRDRRKTLYLLNHLLYVDDIKLYGSSPAELKELLSIVEAVSEDIKMEFGFDKCKVLNIRKGKWSNEETEQFLNNQTVQQMNEEDLYKYLGFHQNRKLNHTEIKQNIRKIYEQRLKALLKSKLNSKNLFKAINTFAIPVLTYSFGIINWSTTDLENIMIHTRTKLTQSRKHHPKSCKERLTLHRTEGGRGLLDIHHLCNRQLESLRSYFINNEHPMHKAIVQADKNLTPLNLSSEDFTGLSCNTIEQKRAVWEAKALHGRHVKNVRQEHISAKLSYRFLQNGQLFPETEGFILAIQDQVIATRNYQKVIIKNGTITDDNCRKCHQFPETIDHITAGCKLLAGTEYTSRHNSVAKIIHQHIALDRELHSNSDPYYKYCPDSILENKDFKLYWDLSIQTDKTISHNRPDLVLFNKKKNIVFLIDIAVPSDANVAQKYTKKLERYRPLAIEVKRLWKIKEVHVIPFIISVTGLTPHTFMDNLKQLRLPGYIHSLIQKAVILHTCNITRAFLNLE